MKLFEDLEYQQHPTSMVFYTEKELSSACLPYLPPELWFHIYRIEHQSKIIEVHRELLHMFKELRETNFNTHMNTHLNRLINIFRNTLTITQFIKNKNIDKNLNNRIKDYKMNEKKRDLFYSKLTT